MKNPVLVVIDIQEKLFPVMNEKETFLKNCVTLIKGFQIFDLPILVTEQVSEKLGPTVEPIRDVFPKFSPIEKTSFSCAGNLQFLELLHGHQEWDKIILCGIESHICVFQTALDLIQRGYNVEVVSDATTSRNESNHNLAMSRIRQEGGHIISVEMLLFWLQCNAEGDRFKELVKLVK